MHNIFIDGKNFGYEVNKPIGGKAGSITVFHLIEKEVESERMEVRTMIEEVEKKREVRNKDTGEMELETYFERVGVKKEVPIVETKIEVKPKKVGDIDIFTFLWPHQEKETVKNFIQSKNK